jgi:hypothetical protein
MRYCPGSVIWTKLSVFEADCWKSRTYISIAVSYSTKYIQKLISAEHGKYILARLYIADVLFIIVQYPAIDLNHFFYSQTSDSSQTCVQQRCLRILSRVRLINLSVILSFPFDVARRVIFMAKLFTKCLKVRRDLITDRKFRNNLDIPCL